MPSSDPVCSLCMGMEMGGSCACCDMVWMAWMVQ